MGFLDGTPFWSRGQDGFRQNPENLAGFPEAPPRHIVLRINGQHVPMTSSEVVMDPVTGKPTEIILVEAEYDEFGNIIACTQIVAKSWTGKKIPEGYAITCANPYRIHGPRLCYGGVDGFITKLTRTPLCTECLKTNERKRKLRNITATIWNPDTY